MTKTTYFFRLRPLSDFFFGGEKNFGNDTEVANYRVSSRRFPQQTAVLGMLRLFLLEQEDGMFDRPASVGGSIQKKDRAKKLIGKKGFSPGKDSDGFGTIQQLSPLLIYNSDTPYFKAPATSGYHLQIKSGLVAYAGGSDHTLPILMDQKDGESNKPFSYKDAPVDSFVSSEGDIKAVKDNPKDKGVFVQKDRIGIQKIYTGKTEDRAFFKMSSYYLAKGFSFGFYATLANDETLTETGKATTHMGGERSLFSINWKKVMAFPQLSLPEGALPKDGYQKICLLSDAFLPNARLHEVCSYIKGDTMPFRCLKTSLETKKHFNLSGKGGREEVSRSGRFTLLKKGAVLYPKKGELKSLTDMLEGIGQGNETVLGFRNIGYNYFHVQQKISS